MKKLLSRIFAGMLALGLAAAPALAKDFDPTGRWQSDTGESRYDVSLCGDGRELCAKAVWLRADAATPENNKYLGTYLLNRARHTGANEWRGTVNYLGHSFGGKIILTNSRTIALEGCVLVFCKTFHLIKIAAK